jgi:long-chain acyl-CoA synthetase
MDKPWLKHYEPQVPVSIEYPDTPVYKFLEDSAEKYPDHTATIYFGRKTTFSQLNSLADLFAETLPGLCFKPGDRVAIMLPNCPQMIAAYYGVLKARGVVVQINPLLSPPEAGYIIHDSGARILICLPRYGEVYAPLLKQNVLRDVVLTDVGDFAPPAYGALIRLEAILHRTPDGPRRGPHIYTLADMMAGKVVKACIKEEAYSQKDLALIQYTGGTTGNPKGVMLTHGNLTANTLQCHAWIHDVKKGPGGDVFMGVTPFFHVYGMTATMNLAIYCACTLVLLPRFMTDMVADAIKKYRCTVFTGVELMYNHLNNSPKSAKGYLRTIRACISGAGPLYRSVQEKFEALTGGRVVEGYGLTEASPVTHCNPLFGDRRIGTIGLPMPDTEALIVDAAGKELPHGTPGEIAVRGPQVMKGYWNREKETAEVLRDGWLYTGDIATMDDDGYFRMMERKKDMIKSRGENVYPRNIEEALRKHLGVAEAVVIGIPDVELGERIKAFIVPAPGAKLNRDELRAFCKKYLAAFEVPGEFEFRDSVPKNLIGKTLRRVLREEEEKKALKPA